MVEDKATFREKVYAVVASVPLGRVLSYGQVAALCGEPRAAWEVGQIAHYGPEKLPWHRVVKKNGGLASGYPGGIEAQKEKLELEGVHITDSREVNMDKYQWQIEPRP